MIIVRQNTAILPALQGIGIGTQLLSRQEEIARSRGATKIIGLAPDNFYESTKAFLESLEYSELSAVVGSSFKSFYQIVNYLYVGHSSERIEGGDDGLFGNFFMKDLTATQQSGTAPFLPSDFTEEVVTRLTQDELNNPDLESWSIKWKQNGTNLMTRTNYLIVKNIS